VQTSTSLTFISFSNQNNSDFITLYPFRSHLGG
jgi:hypothetical protein